MENKQLKVLLVEGQHKVAEEFKKELAALDCKVSTAISTDNALLRVKAFQFDFFIVNCGSTGKDGLNFAKEVIKEDHYKNVPFLFTFNQKLKVDIRLRKFEHPFDIIRLPFDATELRIRMNQLLFIKDKKVEKATPETAEADEKKKTESVVQEKGKVLLVEDNPLNQKVLGMFISKIGFEYDTASNGQMAIDLSSKNKYAFILMDIYMPGMDGTEATEKIREQEEKGDHRARIIAITANESEESVKRCYDSGMDDFMVKPFTIELLKEKLV